MPDKFNVGNLVYCPELGERIFTLVAQSSSVYSLCIKDEEFQLTSDGFNEQHDKYPSVFKATEANCKALQELYGGCFTPPREYLVDLLREHFKHSRNKVVIKTNGDYFIISAINSDSVIGTHSLSQFLSYIQFYSCDTPFLVLGN